MALACSTATAALAASGAIDVDRMAAAGVRMLPGRHLRLFTDLPARDAVDELPAVFDAAVPQWAAAFGVQPADCATWRVDGFLIKDRATFAALGVMPSEHPDFENGFARKDRLWLVEQPSDYYRRHLLLHEGTHAFMLSFLGGAGPGWYMEGTAELFGSHARQRDGKLQLDVFPASRDAVPMWGRVKILRDAAAADASWPLDAVLELDNSRAVGVEGYAWSWALAALLDNHPQFHDRFRKLARVADRPNFNRRFRQAIGADWGDLQCEWRAYAASVDYGYDFARMAMVHREPRDFAAAQAAATIRADRGWQSTGIVLPAGGKYRIAAAGRYVIAEDEQTGEPWPCEPGGVTLRWHAGRPLGELLAALRPLTSLAGGQRPRRADSGSSPAHRSFLPDFAHPQPIGLAATITAATDSVLYLRVNDAPAELAENSGEVDVTVVAD